MKHYKIELNKINKYIEDIVLSNIDSVYLKDIVKYALEGGKRLRSILVIMIGKSINVEINLEKLAMSMELFHNCSLIIDDMPCMDNDMLRRGRETVHYKYGETKSQIVVAYLLKQALNLLYDNINDIKNKQLYSEDYINNITIEIHKNINTNLGILGASGGQFIDTCPINSFIDKEEYIKDYKNVDDILNLIHLKTTTFFEISFVSAYLLAGGNINNIEKIKKCVKYFGLAFQISDDFEDIIEDSKRIVNKEFNPNLICKYGKKKAMDIFNKSITQFINLSKELKIYNKVFIELIEFLNRRITKSLV